MGTTGDAGAVTGGVVGTGAVGVGVGTGAVGVGEGAGVVGGVTGGAVGFPAVTVIVAVPCWLHQA
ncbi:hypothetical protein LJ758_08275 [Arthrobacter sp. zg-Y324]|nr:hypothetical protein [Arthrobacter caoxuetaonis]